jgi:hypothetical protein
MIPHSFYENLTGRHTSLPADLEPDDDAEYMRGTPRQERAIVKSQFSVEVGLPAERRVQASVGGTGVPYGLILHLNGQKSLREQINSICLLALIPAVFMVCLGAFVSDPILGGGLGSVCVEKQGLVFGGFALWVVALLLSCRRGSLALAILFVIFMGGFIPAGIASSLMLVNSLFDSSQTVQHQALITRVKMKVATQDNSRAKCTAFVRSWRAARDTEEIPVNCKDYYLLHTGELVNITTSSGRLGITRVRKVEPIKDPHN